MRRQEIAQEFLQILFEARMVMITRPLGAPSLSAHLKEEDTPENHSQT
jgi:hypothetical protein